MAQRKIRIGSIKVQLLKKSQEAALAAVQIFNNPNITFKSESYIVLMVIAWTYLLHAYYREKGIEYRYFEQKNIKKKFSKTKKGAYRYWELEHCLKDANSPIDKDTVNNLVFLIGLRHEIEHQMTSRIDDAFSARFQACCLNYNSYIQELFGKEYSIESHLSFSLQFSSISTDQTNLLKKHPSLPKNIEGYMKEFDNSLSQEEIDNQRFSYRVLFIPKTTGKKGQADKVVEFISIDSPLAENANKEYATVKETEKRKYLPGEIVTIMKKTYPKFSMKNHTDLWKEKNAKDPAKQYGIKTMSNWGWYQSWFDVVEEHCKQNKSEYQ